MNKHTQDRPAAATIFWIAAAVITALRIATLVISPLELGPDEAQYWFWSRDLDFGYFSKPPLIAWSIALTTGLFGDAGWAARLSAPLYHCGAAALLFYTARRLFNERAGAWAGIGWLVTPGVNLSSFVIATDAPLIFFWSAALFFLVRIIKTDTPQPVNFAGLGGAIGLGMMAKYAMIYFPIALALMAALPGVRQKLFRKHALITAAIAIALFTPNILWNAAHDFQTVSHTAANANWGRDLFKPVALIEFLGGQFVIFGAIFFTALIALAVQWRRLDERQVMLLILSLTPLIIVSVQAFLSRAHANWAVASYPAAMILITGTLLEREKSFWIKANAGLHASIAAVFSIALMAPGFLDMLGLSRLTNDLRGWREQTNAIMAYAPGYDAVVLDDRYLMGEMLYNHPHSPTPFAALSPNPTVDNHYEAFLAFDPKRMKRVLFVSLRDDAAHVDYRFRHIKRLGAVDSELDGETRRYALFEISGYYGPGAD